MAETHQIHQRPKKLHKNVDEKAHLTKWNTDVISKKKMQNNFGKCKIGFFKLVSSAKKPFYLKLVDDTSSICKTSSNNT